VSANDTYRLYVSREDAASDGGHHEELFQVLDFLAGHGASAAEQRAALEPLFRRFRHGLRVGEPDSQVRDQLQELLTQRIARTERVGVDSEGDASDVVHRASIRSDDLATFRDLAQCFTSYDRAYALPYWASIPLPVQTMGPGYKAWRRGSPLLSTVGPSWQGEHYRALQGPAPWPHAGIRTVLDDILPPRRLALPWVRPSRPWWSLRRAWKDINAEAPAKLLVFSRFRAVPAAVSAVLSFEAERLAFNSETSPESVRLLRRERRYVPKRQSQKMLAYFWPSPTLARVAVEAPSPREARRRAEATIRRQLRGQGIAVRGEESRGSAWKVLAWLDRKHLHHWDALTGDEEWLPRLVADWRAVGKPGQVSRTTLRWLARIAAAAPGVVVARSLSKRHPGVLGRDFPALLDLSWRVLRTYLDDSTIRRGMQRATRTDKAPESLLRSVLDGNLEAALDEHLWILERCGHARGRGLITAIRRALDLHAGAARIHESDRSGAFQVACRAAMPFTDARELAPKDGAPRAFRPEQLREAFNSPFWPHVLVTTSVGQEGLDFHLWCRDLLHWDLPSTAVDLEQRVSSDTRN